MVSGNICQFGFLKNTILAFTNEKDQRTKHMAVAGPFHAIVVFPFSSHKLYKAHVGCFIDESTFQMLVNGRGLPSIAFDHLDHSFYHASTFPEKKAGNGSCLYTLCDPNLIPFIMI